MERYKVLKVSSYIVLKTLWSNCFAAWICSENDCIPMSVRQKGHGKWASNCWKQYPKTKSVWMLKDNSVSRCILRTFRNLVLVLLGTLKHSLYPVSCQSCFQCSVWFCSCYFIFSPFFIDNKFQVSNLRSALKSCFLLRKSSSEMALKKCLIKIIQ